jgi:hypothetical protein
LLGVYKVGQEKKNQIEWLLWVVNMS